MLNDTRRQKENQVLSTKTEKKLVEFLSPLLSNLNKQLDRRLVKNILGLVLAIMQHRHRNQGLVLSELGAFLLGAERCCAGTKRIHKLLSSLKWDGDEIADFHWEAGDKRIKTLQTAGEIPMIIWDESVLEKPESLKSDRLCPVRSSKAHRLKRIKPGFFNPPGGRPIFVPGFHWLNLLVIGRKAAPTLAHMRWWTTRGNEKSAKRDEEKEVLAEIDQRWGKEVIHIWDRGFAGNPWLTQAFFHGARFVLRWPKKYHLLDEHDNLRKPGEISKGKRSWEHQELWDARRRCWRKTGIIAFPVSDPAHKVPLWLVVVRRKGQSPWYLLTTEPAHTPELAWKIAFAYARRWQVEMAIRFNKAELAFESPRIQLWQKRYKLLMIAGLVYAFLLSFLQPDKEKLRNLLLRTFCHRTGKRSRNTPAPLYRLRLAFSLLWLTHPPPFTQYL